MAVESQRAQSLRKGRLLNLGGCEALLNAAVLNFDVLVVQLARQAGAVARALAVWWPKNLPDGSL